jgi:predicted nucleic acid-binding protein
LPGRGSRFFLDNNFVIAAVKSGWRESTELLMALLLGDAELYANDELLLEYERYIRKALGLKNLYVLIQNRAILVNPSNESLEICRPFFPSSQLADVVHAATCLEVGATLITNDKHFKKIQEAGIIQVWNISRAVREILQKGSTGQLKRE